VAALCRAKLSKKKLERPHWKEWQCRLPGKEKIREIQDIIHPGYQGYALTAFGRFRTLLPEIHRRNTTMFSVPIWHTEIIVATGEQMTPGVL
jgi:hypothetical protein